MKTVEFIPQNKSYKFIQKMKKKQIREESLRREALIDNYILGRMSREEEEDFIQKCKEDPELKEQAIAQAWLVKAIRKLHK